LFDCHTKDEVEAEKMMLKNYFLEVCRKDLLTSLCIQVESDRDEK